MPNSASIAEKGVKVPEVNNNYLTPLFNKFFIAKLGLKHLLNIIKFKFKFYFFNIKLKKKKIKLILNIP